MSYLLYLHWPVLSFLVGSHVQGAVFDAGCPFEYIMEYAASLCRTRNENGYPACQGRCSSPVHSRPVVGVHVARLTPEASL